tara:strand:- start:615 stop:1304 length:690 start_codon:yes stop_codon:yes gene_type:complete
MYSAGDIISFEIADKNFHGEILGIDDQHNIEVSRLKKTEKQEGRIWEFVADDAWSAIEPKFVTKHIRVGNDASRKEVVSAWKEVGFIPGGDGITFCRVDDEDETTLPMYGGDESSDDDSDDEDKPSANPEMHGYADDGFVIPDDEGSDFDFANPDELDEEGAKFVRETHQAVHDFDKWNPEDKQGKAIKNFVSTMDHKATIQTDNVRLTKGKETIRTSKPPLNKRKRDN